MYRIIQNDCRSFLQLVIHNTLEIVLYICTDGSRNYQSFFYDVRCAYLRISPLGARFTKMAGNGEPLT